MRFPRFRLWTLMIAVAATALLPFGVVMFQRAHEYRRAAVRAGIKTRMFEMGPNASPAAIRKNRERAVYYTKLKEKYDREASRPWRHLPPDSPPPE